MTENPKRIIQQIRQLLVTNILAGSIPPPDEMMLLSREYQAVWRTEDAELLAVLEAPDQPSTKPETPAEYAFDQKTQELHRKKRWFESEQLGVLAKIEKLLDGDERCLQNVRKDNQNLSRQIEICRAACKQATTPAQAEAARRRLHDCQKAQRATSKELTNLDRTRQKVLSTVRHNTVEYLGMVKRLEARRGYRRFLREREQANSGGLGLFGTLGALCAIHRFQKMADGIEKLAKKK
jgi:hypothetical protein